MCTITVNVDEEVIRGVNPSISSPAAISEWAQQLIDSRIQEMLDEDMETVDLETARDILHETVRMEYAQP